jgi:hypothetical protein
VKRLLITILAVLLLLPASPGAAQRSIDVPKLSDELIGTDVERLLMRLNTPIPDSLLGEPFSNARPLSSTLLSEQRVIFDQALTGLIGASVYSLDYIPTEGEASPVADASPQAREPQAVFASSTLTYLLFSEAVDTSDMDAFGSAIQQAMGSQAVAGDIEHITISDAPAVLITSVAIVNAVEFHTHWIAVPVGNVIVVAMVMEGTDPFDAEHFRSDNNSLALSGLAWLDAILNG